MNIISQKLARTTCLFCTIALTACGGGSDSDTTEENGQLADPVTNGPTEPVPAPNEPDPEPLVANSSPPHLRTGNLALRESLSADVQALLPEDCLLEVGGAIYCYSLSTRTLMAVLRSTASIYWQFELPGNEDSNRIEALKILDTFSLGIIANTSTETGRPQYELSRFDIDGAFCCTFNIFEPLAGLKGSSNVPYPAINVDKSYIVAASEADQLAIAGTFSELTPNADPNDLADWIIAGSLLTTLSSDNGERMATRLFKGETIVELDYASRSVLDVKTDVSSYRLDAETLGDERVAPTQNTGPAISEETIAVLLPELYNHLQGNVIEVLGNEVESVSAAFNSSLDDELPECARSSDTGNCFYSIETGPVTFDCGVGNTVTITESETREFVPGSGRNLQTLMTLEFEDCSEFLNDRSLYSSSAMTLNGLVTINTFEGGVRQGNSKRTTYVFDNYSVRYTDKNSNQRQESVTGTLTLNDIATSQLDKRRELDVSQYELAEIVYPRNQPGPVVSPLLELSNMAYTNSTVLGDGVNITSVAVNGSLDAIGDITSNQTLSMLIDPPLFRPYISSTTGLSGGISLTAGDGSSVTISARNTQSGLGEELELTFGSGTSFVRPFESLVRPWIDR